MKIDENRRKLAKIVIITSAPNVLLFFSEAAENEKLEQEVFLRVTRWVGEKIAQNVAQPIFVKINAWT
jgi:hypothetical protein